MSTTSSAVAEPSAGPKRRLGDAKAVGKIVAMSERSVYRNADLGRLPWGVKIGALRRWDLEEIERWISGGCKPVKGGRS